MPLTFAEPLKILVVEDNPADTRVAIAAIAAAEVVADIQTAVDGIEALDCLRGSPPYRPDTILLDLSLPRMRGIDVLAALTQDEDLAAIPVVVMTGSEEREDVLLEARDQVRFYRRKPLDPYDLAAVLHQIANRVRLERLRAAGTPVPPPQRQRES